ncbi:MAG TPA: energy transducer TonB [Candidatus Eisenbacteria bacterium]|nr:energy transducer TonB [Candidatus Eisenbacteria bacterium]
MLALALTLLFAAAQADFDQYLHEASKRVQSHWQIPAKSDGLQARVKFNLDRAGRVSDLSISKSSGRKDFDQSALDAVRKSSPFPPLLFILKKSEVREVEMGFKPKAVTVEKTKAGGKDGSDGEKPRK